MLEPTFNNIVLFIPFLLIFLLILAYPKIRLKGQDKKVKYRKALKITDLEQFDYALKTAAGPAFVYGELEAMDPVYLDDSSTPFLSIKEETEVYTRHTRQVNKSSMVAGKYESHWEEEVYYSWDAVGSTTSHANEIRFANKTFPYSRFIFPWLSQFHSTINRGINERVKRYVIPAHMTGSIFTTILEEDISEKSPFYKNCTPYEAMKKAIREHLILDIGLFVLACIAIIFFAVLIILPRY